MHNRLLATLRPADLSRLAPVLREVTLRQGEILYESGKPIDHVYFPHTGMVSLVTVMHDGEGVETATIGYDGAVGAMSGLGDRRAFTRAIVQLPGTASRVRASQFQKIVSANAGIRSLVVDYNDALLRQVQQATACNALHDIDARLSRWLLQSHDRFGSNTIPLTQEFLSQMLGVRRASITLAAGRLQKAGLIRYHRGLIEILDRAGLERTACECYRIIRRQIAQAGTAA